MKLELHQLDQKYASLRAREPAREQRLLASLGERGQQTPVWVTATEEAGRYVLIDGYARARALRALGRDEVEALVMELPEAEALLRSFGLDNTRPRLDAAGRARPQAAGAGDAARPISGCESPSAVRGGTTR